MDVYYMLKIVVYLSDSYAMKLKALMFQHTSYTRFSINKILVSKKIVGSKC